MALKQFATGGKSQQLSATGTITLGNAESGPGGAWLIQVKGLGAGDSITPKATVEEGEANGLVAGDRQAIAYQKMSDGSTVAGATAITADGLYKIIADGLSVVLAVTIAVGPVTVWAVPVAA